MTSPHSIVLPARAFMVAAAALVFLAAVSLLFFGEQTERYFSWTIQPPLTAAFLGAGYAATALALVVALREREWCRVRAGVAVVATGLVVILAATLLHLDRFHLRSPWWSARFWAWAWLVWYVALVPMLAWALWAQWLQRVPDPARATTLAPWLRVSMLALAVVAGVIGAALFFFPVQSSSLWPWPLTPLTGRMAGAWVGAVAVSLAAAVRENDYARIRVPSVGAVAFGSLQLLNLWRHSAALGWAEPRVWVFAAFMGGLLAVGVSGLRTQAQPD
jgi:hypothetical protein